jgi:hypothetical protein
MLAECLNKMAFGFSECFRAFFKLGFLWLPSAIFIPYGEDMLKITAWIPVILIIFPAER